MTVYCPFRHRKKSNGLFKMLYYSYKKAILTLYLSIVRPYLSLTQASNMSSGSIDADKYSVAYVTVPSTDVGKTIGHGLVQNKLAACVNIIPQVTSIYEWKNEINEDNEALLMIKTRTSQVDKLTEYVRSNHPYEVCEVISLPIKNGNPPYLRWIGETVPEQKCDGCNE